MGMLHHIVKKNHVTTCCNIQMLQHDVTFEMLITVVTFEMLITVVTFEMLQYSVI